MLPPTFPADLVQFVQDELASGRYETEIDVLCHGLRLLREREQRLQSLRADIQAGIDELDRGEGEPWDIEAIRAEAKAEFGLEQQGR